MGHNALDDFEKRTSDKIAIGYNNLATNVHEFLGSLLRAAVGDTKDLQLSLKNELDAIKREFTIEDKNAKKADVKAGVKETCKVNKNKNLVLTNVRQQNNNMGQSLFQNIVNPLLKAQTEGVVDEEKKVF